MGWLANRDQLRTAENDLVIYQPYQSPIEGSKDTALRLLKLPHTYSPPTVDPDAMEDDETPKRCPLRMIHDLNGYSTVWLPGSPSHLIVKSASSPPNVVPVAGGEIQSLHSLNTSKCRNGIAYIDDKVSLPFFRPSLPTPNNHSP